MSKRRLKRVWLSEEAAREAKKQAATSDLRMTDYFDRVLLGDKKRSKKRGGGFDFDSLL